MLIDHRQALLTLTGELSALAETNKHLMAAGLKAVEQTLAGSACGTAPPPLGYDAQGRTEMIPAPARGRRRPDAVSAG